MGEAKGKRGDGWGHEYNQVHARPEGEHVYDKQPQGVDTEQVHRLMEQDSRSLGGSLHIYSQVSLL